MRIRDKGQSLSSGSSKKTKTVVQNLKNKSTKHASAKLKKKNRTPSLTFAPLPARTAAVIAAAAIASNKFDTIKYTATSVPMTSTLDRRMTSCNVQERKKREAGLNAAAKVNLHFQADANSTRSEPKPKRALACARKCAATTATTAVDESYGSKKLIKSNENELLFKKKNKVKKEMSKALLKRNSNKDIDNKDIRKNDKVRLSTSSKDAAKRRTKKMLLTRRLAREFGPDFDSFEPVSVKHGKRMASLNASCIITLNFENNCGAVSSASLQQPTRASSLPESSTKSSTSKVATTSVVATQVRKRKSSTSSEAANVTTMTTMSCASSLKNSVASSSSLTNCSTMRNLVTKMRKTAATPLQSKKKTTKLDFGKKSSMLQTTSVTFASAQIVPLAPQLVYATAWHSQPSSLLPFAGAYTSTWPATNLGGVLDNVIHQQVIHVTPRHHLSPPSSISSSCVLAPSHVKPSITYPYSQRHQALSHYHFAAPPGSPFPFATCGAALPPTPRMRGFYQSASMWATSASAPGGPPTGSSSWKGGNVNCASHRLFTSSSSTPMCNETTKCCQATSSSITSSRQTENLKMVQPLTQKSNLIATATTSLTVVPNHDVSVSLTSDMQYPQRRKLPVLAPAAPRSSSQQVYITAPSTVSLLIGSAVSLAQPQKSSTNKRLRQRDKSPLKIGSVKCLHSPPKPSSKSFLGSPTKCVGSSSKKCRPSALTPTSCQEDWIFEGEPYINYVFTACQLPPTRRLCYPSMRHNRDGQVIFVYDNVLIRSAAAASGLKDDAVPYVAKITGLYVDPSTSQQFMSLLWYYRPEQMRAQAASQVANFTATDLTASSATPTNTSSLTFDSSKAAAAPHNPQSTRIPRSLTPADIYASRHRDQQQVATIEDKCYVLTRNQYMRWLSEIRRRELGRPISSHHLVVPDNSSSLRAALPGSDVPEDNVFLCRGYYDYTQRRVVRNPMLSSPKSNVSPPVFSPRGLDSDVSQMLPTHCYLTQILEPFDLSYLPLEQNGGLLADVFVSCSAASSSSSSSSSESSNKNTMDVINCSSETEQRSDTSLGLDGEARLELCALADSLDMAGVAVDMPIYDA